MTRTRSSARCRYSFSTSTYIERGRHPVIASAVGPYLCIEHERTGLLVDDDRDWKEAIDRLLRDRKFAEQLVANAREDVLMRFNATKNCELWARAIRALCSEPAKFNTRKFELIRTDMTVNYSPVRYMVS